MGTKCSRCRAADSDASHEYALVSVAIRTMPTKVAGTVAAETAIKGLVQGRLCQSCCDELWRKDILEDSGALVCARIALFLGAILLLVWASGRGDVGIRVSGGVLLALGIVLWTWYARVVKPRTASLECPTTWQPDRLDKWAIKIHRHSSPHPGATELLMRKDWAAKWVRSHRDSESLDPLTRLTYELPSPDTYDQRLRALPGVLQEAVVRELAAGDPA